MNTPQTELAKSLQLEVYHLRAENEELRKSLQKNQTMNRPLRKAYSQKELSEALNKWMIERWGESPANLSPCHRDRYYRDNGLIYHFIADHFPIEKKAMNETPNPDDQDKRENYLIKPIAKMMREKGIARMVISVKNGKAEYILDPTENKEP